MVILTRDMRTVQIFLQSVKDQVIVSFVIYLSIHSCLYLPGWIESAAGEIFGATSHRFSFLARPFGLRRRRHRRRIDSLDFMMNAGKIKERFRIIDQGR